MKFTIVERKAKISDDLRAYSTKKVQKLDRYFPDDSDATLTFTELKGKQTVEVTIKRGGMIYRAEETTSDMYGSIDGAVAKLERQIRKHKTRLEKRLRDGAFEKAAAQSAELESDDFDVTRHKTFVVKPMSVEEAMLQMDLLGHQFFFFRNADNDNVHAVVYKRANGGYGLIESE